MVRLRTILVLWVCGSIAFAGDAVDGIGGKVGLGGGSMESDQGTLASGSLCLPVTHRFGFQVDGLYTQVSDRDFWGTGAHLFWRNPDKGLVGLVGGMIHEEGIDGLQGGLETEYYLDSLTLGLRAGIARLEYDGGPLPFIDTELTKAFADAEIAYYPLENLMVSGSCGYVFDNALVRGQVEYLTGFRGLALYADAAVGENQYDHVLLGVRWYFGGGKSLKAHHRQDDPRDFTPTILYGIGTYGAEFNRNARDYVRTHQSDDGGGGSGGYGLIATAYGSNLEYVFLHPNPPVTE